MSAIPDADHLSHKRTVLIALFAIMSMLSGVVSGIFFVNDLFDGSNINNFEKVFWVVLNVIFSVLLFVIGYGLWKLKNWARIATILLCYLSLLWYLIEIISMMFASVTAAVDDSSLQADGVYVFILGILLDILIIVYFSQKRIRERFS